MKTVLYHVFTDENNWMDIVVEDFRYIATSGLFKKCDKLIIKISGSEISKAEEWVRFFWGRIDDEHKLEIHQEKSDEIIYSSTNFRNELKKRDVN